MARGRGPTASASSSVLGRSSAVQTWRRARDGGAPRLRALPVLHGAEPGRQLIKVDLLDVHLTQEGAGQGGRRAAASPNQCRTVLGATAKTRAVARRPSPQLSTPARAPCVPRRPACHGRSSCGGRGNTLARGALQLAPGAAMGMAMGAQSPRSSQPREQQPPMGAGLHVSTGAAAGGGRGYRLGGLVASRAPRAPGGRWVRPANG